MSRVDEAMKRAGRQDAREGHVSVVDRPASGLSELDRYVVERPAVERPGVTLVTREPRPPSLHSDVQVEWRSVSVPSDVLGKLVNDRDVDTVVVEQYRRLATVLCEAQVSRNIHCLMVTSAIPREGKTLTTTNLALTLSDSYQRRVLAIDADLRKPSLHRQFGVANEGGLADFLRSAEAPYRPIEVSTHLSVLPAGRLNSSPVAALGSARMQSLLADAASRFDWVLLDTPPVALLSDAQLVARVSDGVLLVIAADLAPYQLVQRAIGDLGADRVVGTVLNRIDHRALLVGEYYGRYYDGGRPASRLLTNDMSTF
jgi:capsular exopolysaccharide synthesis family protein